LGYRGRCDRGFEAREFAVGEKADQARGRIKEAAGSLTGDEDLKDEGKVDRLSGELKEKVEHVKDKVEVVIDKAKDARHKK